MASTIQRCTTKLTCGAFWLGRKGGWTSVQVPVALQRRAQAWHPVHFVERRCKTRARPNLRRNPESQNQSINLYLNVLHRIFRPRLLRIGMGLLERGKETQ